MRLKLDENLSELTAIVLRALGHDVHTVGDEGLLSRPDEEVGAAAMAEDRTLFTLDQDFGDIRRFAPGRRPGIVVFRPALFTLDIIERMLVDFLASPDAGKIEGATVIVEPGRTRVRRAPPGDVPPSGPASPKETRG